MVQTAAALAAQGVAVTLFDFPYMAEGRRLPDRMPRLISAFVDVAGAVHEARQSLPLFAGGKSLGGRVATHVAADLHAALPSLAGVVALGYPLRPPSARRPQDRTSHLPHLTAPLLIVQGTRDAFGGPDSVAAALTEAGVSRSTVIPVADADHSFRVPVRSTRTQDESDAVWQQAVVAWMRAHAVRP
ncbi:MAG: alpha/beta hydrolase [Acidobacteria bacterium]|nr:alpha/beta hydrolase [Acidobacteriota bacterium]